MPPHLFHKTGHAQDGPVLFLTGWNLAQQAVDLQQPERRRTETAHQLHGVARNRHCDNRLSLRPGGGWAGARPTNATQGRTANRISKPPLPNWRTASRSAWPSSNCSLWKWEPSNRGQACLPTSPQGRAGRTPAHAGDWHVPHLLPAAATQPLRSAAYGGLHRRSKCVDMTSHITRRFF